MSRLDWQLAASHTSIDESGTDYLYWVDHVEHSDIRHAAQQWQRGDWSLRWSV